MSVSLHLLQRKKNKIQYKFLNWGKGAVHGKQAALLLFKGFSMSHKSKNAVDPMKKLRDLALQKKLVTIFGISSVAPGKRSEHCSSLCLCREQTSAPSASILKMAPTASKSALMVYKGQTASYSNMLMKTVNVTLVIQTVLRGKLIYFK